MPVITNNNKEVARLIIIRGAPAVGKSTIAKKVAALNSAKKKTYLAVDNFQTYDLRTMSKDREKLAIRNAALLTKNFLLEGFDTVVDYVFDDIDDLKKFMEFTFSDTLGKIDTIYVQEFYLDAPIEQIVKRNQSRSGKRGEYMNVALLKKLYAKTSATKGLLAHETVIDTTRYSAKQCARYILSNQEAYQNDLTLETVQLPLKDLERALESE